MSAIASIMTKNPRSVSPTTSVVSAAKTMKAARISALFVKKGKQLVGIVTDTDIVRRAVSSGKPLGRLTVEKIMTAPIRTIEAAMPVDDAQDMMGDFSIRHLGVTRNGDIVGVVSVRICCCITNATRSRRFRRLWDIRNQKSPRTDGR